MEDGFLSTRELCTRWGLVYHTLYKWRLRGCGPKFHKINKRVAYHLEDIERFEKSRRCQSTSEYPLKLSDDSAESNTLKKQSMNQLNPLFKNRN